MSAMAPLQSKISRLLIWIATLSFLMAATLAAVIEYRQQRDNLTRVMHGRVQVARASIEESIKTQTEQLQRMARVVEGLDATDSGPYDQDLLLQQERRLVYRLDQQGRVIALTSKFRHMLGLDFSRLAHVRNREFVSEVHQSLISRRSVISLSTDLADGGRLVMEKDLAGMIPQLAALSEGELLTKEILFILSRDGTVVHHPDPDLVKSRHNLGLELQLQHRWEQLGLGIYRLLDQTFIAHQEQITAPAGWTVTYAVPARLLILDILTVIAGQFFILLIVFSFLFITLVVVLNRYFSSPVTSMVKHLDAYPAGDATTVVPVMGSRGILEFGRIIEAVNGMAAKLHRSQDELKAREQLFRTVSEYAVEWVFLLDQDGSIRYISPSCERITGYSQEEFYSDTDLLNSIVHPDDKSLWREHRHGIHHDSHTMPLDFRIVTKSGRQRWIRHLCSSITGESGQTLGSRASNVDITEQKKAERELYQNAFYDRLTGLANRNLFLDRLLHALQQRTRSDYQFAVLFLDLDRFKVINDSLGHMLGDRLLAAVALRLKEQCRPGDTVARLGGDEFAFLLDDIPSTDVIRQFVQRVHTHLRRPFHIEGHEIYTEASIGVAVSKDNYREPDDMLRDADTAMYQAKSMGRGRTEYFSTEMHVRALERLRLETDLRKAVQRGEIINYYQPIISLDTGMVAGFESLARWPHPERGLRLPNEFIPLAEETEIIVPLGEICMELAAEHLQLWQEKYARDVPIFMNINISGIQLHRPELPGFLDRIIERCNLIPHTLHLELTESMLLDGTSAIDEALRHLHHQGIPLTMDDFGTGFSSLSCLCRFPFSCVKIDKEFIRNMTSSTRDRDIVRAILDMAKGLQMQTVAEGIEGVDQYSMLKDYGCDYGQGYLFARPMEAEAVNDLLLQQALFRIEDLHTQSRLGNRLAH